jgi:DNA-binding XRE family transcriptional regulator
MKVGGVYDMSIVKALQSEITRLARKEVKKLLEPVKRVNAAQRGYIADLRREVSDLQKEVARLRKEAGVPAPVVVEDENIRFRITGKGVVSLRKRLGLTQAEFGELAGVSTQSVVKWEKHEGKIPIRRKETLAIMQDVRSMDKRTAWQKLGKEKGKNK